VANVREFDVQSSDFANGAGFASVKEIERIGAELIAKVAVLAAGAAGLAVAAMAVTLRWIRSATRVGSRS